MDQGHKDRCVSAFEFDVVREAFRRSVKETNLAEAQWADHAKRLLREMCDGEPDEDLIERIIGR
jgi:hypothetical protein